MIDRKSERKKDKFSQIVENADTSDIVTPRPRPPGVCRYSRVQDASIFACASVSCLLCLLKLGSRRGTRLTCISFKNHSKRQSKRHSNNALTTPLTTNPLTPLRFASLHFSTHLLPQQSTAPRLLLAMLMLVPPRPPLQLSTSLKCLRPPPFSKMSLSPSRLA